MLILFFAGFSQSQSSAFEIDSASQESVMTLKKRFEELIQEQERSKKSQTLRPKRRIENRNVELKEMRSDKDPLLPESKDEVIKESQPIEKMPKQKSQIPPEEMKKEEKKKKKRRSFKKVLFNEKKSESQKLQKPKFYSSDYIFGIDPEKYKQCLIEDRKAGREQGGAATQVNLFQQTSMATRIPENSSNFQKGDLFKSMLDAQEKAGKNLFSHGFTMSEIVALQNLDIFIGDINNENMDIEEIKKYKKRQN